MDPAVVVEEIHDSVPCEPVESLIITYFDRTFMVLNVFIDDPRTCLEHSQDIFRTVQENGQVSQKALFCALVKRVRRLHNKNVFLEGVSHDSVLCWLLKETSQLKYADIGSLMGLDREQVKLSVAAVRSRLLS